MPDDRERLRQSGQTGTVELPSADPQASKLRSTHLDFFEGTLAPFFRASDRPMAIACFRLFTRPPLPPCPERSVPCFRRRIALRTLLLAPWLYLRREPRLAAISFLHKLEQQAGKKVARS